MWAQEAIDTASDEYIQNGKVRKLPVPDDPDPEPINAFVSPVIDGLSDPVPRNTASAVVIPDLSIKSELDGLGANAGFGTKFPTNPGRGDLYLRVDYLPSKLHKWNGVKWIEVDKNTTDLYAYDEEYIKHLVEKLQAGEYDEDLLTTSEQEQISRYLNGQSTS